MDYRKIPVDLEFGPKDKRDYTLDMLSVAEGVYPDEYMFPIQTPVLNQGYTSMCLDFTYRTIEEMQHAFNCGEYVRYANGYRYGQKLFPNIEGMLEMMEVNSYTKEGIPTADLYNIVGSSAECKNYYATHINENIKTDALSHRNRVYITVTTADEVIKSLINFRSPGYVGITVYDTFYSTGSDGIVSDEIGVSRGGHAMCVIGVTLIDGKQYLVVKNSWGEDWGDNGHCYIAFDNPIISTIRMFCDATPENEIITLRLGSKTIKTLKGDIELDVAPQLVNGRTMVPVRFITEILGYTVDWTSNESDIYIYKDVE